MPASVKAALREHSADRRRRTRLLKDCDADLIRVACDWAMENLVDDGTRRTPCYLRYASADQVAAFRQWLPQLVAQLMIPGRGRGNNNATSRTVYLFHAMTLWLALEFRTGVNARKYWNYYPDRLEEYQIDALDL